MNKTESDFMKKELARSAKTWKPEVKEELSLREYIEFQLEDRRKRFTEQLMMLIIFGSFSLLIMIIVVAVYYSPQNMPTEIIKICQTITHFKGGLP